MAPSIFDDSFKDLRLSTKERVRGYFKEIDQDRDKEHLSFVLFDKSASDPWQRLRMDPSVLGRGVSWLKKVVGRD